MAGVLVTYVTSHRRGTRGIAHVGILTGGGNAVSRQSLALTGTEKGYGAHDSCNVIGYCNIGQIDIAGVGHKIGPDNRPVFRYVGAGGAVGIIAIGALDQAYARRLAIVMAGVLVADMRSDRWRACSIAQIRVLAG